MRGRKETWIIAIIVITILTLGSISAYAVDRRNCICYKAEHSPGTMFPMDSQVMALIDGLELDPETMRQTTTTCRHGKSLFLRLWGEDEYQASLRTEN